MTQSKHTPGPWSAVADEDSARIGGCDWRIITPCSLDDHDALVSIWDRRDGEDVAANARLIAAAPDMLEALKKIVFDWDGEPEDMADARAAIAKAEGRE